ncbi:MAG: HIT domain-containing protein [archaeon]
MVLTNDQIAELKEQLREQVRGLPAEKKEEAEKQIEEMSSEAIEAMVQQQQQRAGIFRAIVSKQIDSVIVGENDNALAVLDINPISKGHVLIVPKEATQNPQDIDKGVFELGEELSKKITENLDAKSVRMETDNSLGEAIVHLIPIYDKELTKDSERGKATKEELEEVKKKLETIKVEKKVETIKVKKKRGRKPKPIKMKRRVP